MIDLRSDTVTRPTPAMRGAMAKAEVGDDVFQDDPGVQKLEAVGADMLGKEAALFAPSGTQTNLIALLTHCGRGDEYLVGQEAHTYLYEGGGGAVLGSIQPQPLLQEPDGTLDLEKLRRLIKPNDYHFARTRLLALENTTNGKVLPVSYLAQSRAFADEHSLALHLDGARLCNAAIASGTSAAELAAPFDSISLCLSKGLGAPVGSLLAGSRDFVREGKRWRKMLGGGMRQSGILAAAGIHALEHHVDRLTEDHDKAKLLANGLAPFAQVEPVQTNMVFATFPEERVEELVSGLSLLGILVLGGSPRLRLVTHLDVSKDDIRTVIRAVGEIL